MSSESYCDFGKPWLLFRLSSGNCSGSPSFFPVKSAWRRPKTPWPLCYGYGSASLATWWSAAMFPWMVAWLCELLLIFGEDHFFCVSWLDQLLGCMEDDVALELLQAAGKRQTWSLFLFDFYGCCFVGVGLLSRLTLSTGAEMKSPCLLFLSCFLQALVAFEGRQEGLMIEWVKSCEKYMGIWTLRISSLVTYVSFGFASQKAQTVDDPALVKTAKAP